MRLIATLWKSTHPGPTLVVSALALALGLSIDLSLDRLTLLVLSIFCGQLSIGLSNDAIDAPRDRASQRTDKPLAQPGAPVRAALICAAGTVVIALVLSALLSLELALFHAVFLTSGWAYNAALKSTVWSAACFVVGFGVFPSLPTLAMAEPQLAPFWAWVAGATLGIAVHFSNVLPDLDDDERTGVRGLPHRIGRRGSVMIAFGAVMLGAAVVLAGQLSRDTADLGPVPWITFGAVIAVALWGLIASLAGATTRLSFRVVMLAALLLAVQLVGTGYVSH